jgi:hypothetical protein
MLDPDSSKTPGSIIFFNESGYEKLSKNLVLRIRIRIRCFLTPGSGSGIRDRKKSGSGMNIPDVFSVSLETFW